MDINYQTIIREDLGDYVSSFYLAIKHELSIQDIYTYSNTFLGKRTETLHSIIITKEKCLHTHKETGGEHYHFVLFHRGDNTLINKKTTNSLMRHFAEKYNLTGTSDGKKVRQYGLIRRSIKSVPNILRYITKDISWGNYLAPPYSHLDIPLFIITHNQESQTQLFNILEGLPKWEKNEEATPTKFSQTIIDILKEETNLNPQIINNDFELIKIILHNYHLAKRHPPTRTIVQKYLRIVQYNKLSLYDFIEKYYL
jgi:hypothetical protein